MKKTIFALLLVVAMAVALVVPAIATNANAAEYNPYHCICGAKQYADANATTPSSTKGTCKCDGVNHTWTALDGKTSTYSADGYYYLAEDMTLENAISLGGNLSSNMAFSLDLAGKKMTTTNRAFVLLDTGNKSYSLTLNICDTVGDGEITSPLSDAGGVIWDDWREDTHNGKIINIYGGKLTSTATSTDQTGTVICLTVGKAYLNLYDGVITGSDSLRNGGAIYLNYSSATIYGGIINGSKAVSGAAIACNNAPSTLTIKGGIINGGTATDFGGAISLAKNTKLIMDGGVIDARGKTAGHGAAIGSNGGSVTINDGLIIGGTSTGSGGAAISSFTSGNKLTINGGTITGGIHNGSNIVGRGGAVRVSSGTLVMTGGTITGGTNKVGVGGGLMVTGTSSATISGNVVITGNTDKDGNASNLYLDGTNKITFGEGGLGSKAKIGVSMTTPGAFTAANTSAYAANFIADDGKYFVVANADKALELTDKLDGFVALVGSTPYATVEEAVDAITDSKTQSVKLITNVTQTVEIKKDVYLDLNGKDMDTVTVADGATLYVMDSTTADYAVNTTNRDYGVIKTINGKVARTFLNADNYKYLVVKTTDGYSAHRIYMAVTSSIIDGTKNGGMKYSTVLKCDELVAGLIADYGVTVSNGTTSQNVSNFGTGETCTINAWGGSNMNEKVSGVYEILKSGDAGNAAASEIAFGASAYITLNDSFGDEYKTVNSAVKERSMQEMVVKAVANWGSLTAEQQATLKAIYNAFNNGAYMDDKTKWPNVADKLK